MTPIAKTDADTSSDKVQHDRADQLWRGLIFGVVFGFLLQKGGVAKFEILIGVLLLQDFTVIEVMLSAIVVGMAGVFAMYRLGWVQLHLKSTRYGANIVGGLVFGVGFALSGYCPGTGAAALGQGNFDAVAVMTGMVAGSYVYALCSRSLNNSIESWGDRGKLTLAEVVHVPRALFVPIFAGLLVIVLVALAFSPTLPPPRSGARSNDTNARFMSSESVLFQPDTFLLPKQKV